VFLSYEDLKRRPIILYERSDTVKKAVPTRKPRLAGGIEIVELEID
jgi:hypothetical protein